ncbi:MAG: hypothetical protein AB8E87_01900 [Prochlorococcus sp.]
MIKGFLVILLLLVSLSVLQNLQRNPSFRDADAWAEWIENIKWSFRQMAKSPSPETGREGFVLNYNDFTEAVKTGRVSRAIIPSEHGNAKVVLIDGRRALVELSSNKELLKLPTVHNVDFAVQPKR